MSATTYKFLGFVLTITTATSISVSIMLHCPGYSRLVSRSWSRLLLGLFFLLLTPLPGSAKQPIAFSHKLHATQNGIACQYCHLYARRSYSSGVPPVSTCIGCHGPNERKLARPDSAEVNKMRAYWSRSEPVPWMKVHDIPDYVRFPHKKHINADSSRFIEKAGSGCDLKSAPRSLECRLYQFRIGGDTRCESCHGPVSNMEFMQVIDDNFGGMGWCLKCHLQVKGAVARKRTGSTMAGWFHAKENDRQRELRIMLVNAKGHHNPNVSDCATCHY